MYVKVLKCVKVLEVCEGVQVFKGLSVSVEARE